MSPENIEVPTRDPSSSRRLTAWLFCGVLAIGIVSGGAYLTLRAVSAKSGPPPAARPAAPPVVAASAPAPEQPVSEPSAPPPAAEPPRRSSSETSAGELKGHRFLQVGAVERGQLDNFVRKLARHGFAVRVAEGPSQNVVRVLFGPIERSETEAKQAELKQAGFDSFPRVY